MVSAPSRALAAGPATAPLAAEPARPVAVQPVPNGYVTNVFVDTDLRQALQDIASQAGVTIIPEQTVSGIVSADLKNVSVDKALDILLAGTGYAVVKTPDYYLVYSVDIRSPVFHQVSDTRVVKLGNLTPDSVSRLISPAFRDFVQMDGLSNTVSITAPGPLAERILADIKRLDQPPRHVLLEARVVVLERDEISRLGVKWDFPTIQYGAFTNNIVGSGWPWGLRLGYTPNQEFTNSLMLTINLMAQNEQATIVANPQVMSQDGKAAEIKVTTEEYFQIVTAGTVFVQSQLEKIETGTLVKVTPRLTEDGQITLVMEVEVSDVAARGTNNLPVVNRRTASSTVRVQNGGTAAIAGLMDSRRQSTQRRVPGAGDVPGFGELFRDRSDSRSSKQVAVFVTATLVGDDHGVQERRLPKARMIPHVDDATFKQALAQSLARIAKEGQDR
ncbi:MAG: secretin and TonB N-terminal domain-containing protein [Phycisphaeraceae bacterium]